MINDIWKILRKILLRNPHSTFTAHGFGHFSGGSVWPIVMGIGCVIGIEGFVYGTWLLVFGLVLFVWAAVGLMQESRG